MRHRTMAVNGGRRRLMFALHAAGVLALAVWVRGLDASAGIAAAAIHAVIALLAVRGGRRGDGGLFLLLALGSAFAVTANYRGAGQTAIARTAPQQIAVPFERRLASEIAIAQRRLEAAATSAAGGTSIRAALPDLRGETGLIVFTGSSISWTGRSVVPADGLWERAGVVATPFYVVQYAAVLTGGRRAVAMSVVHARPPANRLSNPLSERIADMRTVRFDVAPVPLTQTGGTYVDIGGTRLSIQARVTDPAAYAVAVEQTSRKRAAVMLLAGTVASLVVLLRSARRLRERVFAVAIPIVALAVTPLNTLSNVTRLFDAATYYVAGGGPFTASVGALAITSALALFVVTGLVRNRARPRRRIGALVAVLAIAGTAPYLLRYLARGINLPPNGASTSLWLAWEVALFLAGTSFLVAGVSAGQWALGAKRGLRVWVAPVLAAIAALLGPALITDAATWPAWYPALWVAAIASLVLARRSRATLLTSAFVAACGATVLSWGATLRQRTVLASRDVGHLTQPDAEVFTLLERLGAAAAANAPPVDQQRLLARYAAADLASTDYPVSLMFWPADSAPTILSLRGGEARFSEVAQLRAEAIAADAPLVRAFAPGPASAVGLVVPFPGGGTFSAVVSARTQLTRPSEFPRLFGLAEDDGRAPYRLSYVIAPPPNAAEHAPWQRMDTHLHSEWTLPSGAGATVRIRANVAFEPYETLLPAGLLVVLFDFVIVLVLLAVDLFAAGVLGRWLRLRRNRLRRSYRLQLSLALFAFFVVPAGVFALWSYRRLHADDRAARELLLRDALRRASTTASDSVGIPRDVPYFLYRNGQLAGASDSLLLSVAPVGYWLESSVSRLLTEADDVIATTPIRVGESDVLFGYRTLSPSLVAAVPARADDAAIEKRRSDLGILVILATVLGALGALGLSGVAARKLARPIGALRSAALAVAGGSREPLRATDAPAEFLPVFRAFDRMARDLAASEAQLTRAERVLAWGEMARQVAHEIKNPLTPIRLGVQHLLRAWRDGRPDFDAILEENSARLLREIDHLDATARSFSRFGAMPEVPAAPERIDVAAVVRDVVSLEELGADETEWRVTGADAPCAARARAHELREVLINLCENARNALARVVEIRLDQRDGRVVLSVVDDGEGVPSQLHARVFEPHFSTRTSGSGLGLAISRQLVESWGGSIDLYSEPGVGTTVRITLEADTARLA